MALKLLMAVAAGLTLSACANRHPPAPSAPVAANFPASKQAQLQATDHWQVVARSVERQLAVVLKKTPTRPVFIVMPAEPNPFQRALLNQLTTALVNDGFTVARAPAGALKIDLDVQTLVFSAKRPQTRYKFGQRVPLAGGVWMAQELTAAPVEKPAVDAVEFDVTPGATPRTEIIVTISVADQYRYLARSTSAYYVADADYALYGLSELEPENTKLTRVFKVRGDL